MNVVIKGSVDIDNIPNADFIPFATAVADITKEYFGDPEHLREFEKWKKARQRHLTEKATA